MGNKREYFKFNFNNVVKFDCTCGRRYINTSNCFQETDSKENQTNGDIIRSMSNGELAKYLVFLDGGIWYSTVTGGRHWLKEEDAVEEVEKWLKSEEGS